MKKSITPMPYMPAMPVVIVATQDGDHINFAPHGMVGLLCNDPPLIYVSVIKEHLTAKIIGKTGRFSINIPDTDMLGKIRYCGSVSGTECDKSGEFDVFHGRNGVPMINECPVNLNCEVYETIDTKEMIIFIGKVVETFSDEDCLEEDMPVATKVDPLVCTIQGKYFKMGNEVK